jgi:hypothetical protein
MYSIRLFTYVKFISKESIMKKILMAATAALCFAGSSFAQENAGGDSASSSAFGDMNKETIVAGVVAVGVLGAMVANNRGDSKPVVIIDPPPVNCGAGEELVDGECVPVTPTTSVTTTVTATNTVTSTITNPVTVTATTTTI